MTFDPLCIDCTEQGCTRCMQGYHFDETSLTCRECTRDYDPRCLSCDSETCLKCMDRELLSIRRSGPRASDPASFHNELKELAVTLLHGTQQTDYFDESEPFRVVSNASMRRPLFEETKRCDQGQMGSSAWNCSSIISNVKLRLVLGCPPQLLASLLTSVLLQTMPGRIESTTTEYPGFPTSVLSSHIVQLSLKLSMRGFLP